MSFGSKKIYIASKEGVEYDDYGNENPYFSEIIPFNFSYMPSSSQVDYQIYGKEINNIYVSILPMNYLGKIKSGDAVYLIDGETQNIEELVYLDIDDKYCSHANYRVKDILPQNVRVKVIFEKTQKARR